MVLLIRNITFFFLFLSMQVFAQPKAFDSHRPTHFPDPPKLKNRMFYLQRNLNANTVIYDLNYDLKNQLNSEEPLDVFYLKYTLEGQRAELKWIERKFAYGYSSKKMEGTQDFEVTLHAYDKRKIYLKRQGNTYTPLIEVNGKKARLTNLFVQADESGLWPRVQFIEIFAEDLTTGKLLFEKFYP